MTEKPYSEKPQAEVQSKTFKHIVRVANVDIPGGKAVHFALTKIKGIGINLSDIICVVSGIKKTTKAGDLTLAEVEKLNQIVKNPFNNGIPSWMLNRRKDFDTGKDTHLLEGTLNFVTENDLKKLKKIKTLRGIRHQKGLPVRGQRTRSNFRKSKGKVVGVAKKASAAKKAAGANAPGKK